jgi:hypothetical protein
MKSTRNYKLTTFGALPLPSSPAQLRSLTVNSAPPPPPRLKPLWRTFSRNVTGRLIFNTVIAITPEVPNVRSGKRTTRRIPHETTDRFWTCLSQKSRGRKKERKKKDVRCIATWTEEGTNVRVCGRYWATSCSQAAAQSSDIQPFSFAYPQSCWCILQVIHSL